MPTTRTWWWRVFALVTLLAGCAAPPYAKNDEVTALVQAYRQQSLRAAQPPSPGGIRALTVEPNADKPGEFVVTADLERASLNVVVRRLLEQTRIPHLIIPQSLVGRVTGRFEKHPFAQVLRQLLEAHGYVATVQDGLTVITEGGRPPAAAPASGAAPDAPAAPLSRAVQLHHLDMESATKFLEGLFPVDPRTGARPISWAAQPYTSTVFVSGPGPEIARAVRLLDEMDRDPTHVMIEVLIVELDTNELERLGADLVNFMQDKFSQLSTGIGGVNVIPGVGAAPAALRFLFTQTQNNRRQFETVIDVLSAQDKARIIARPYMAASSGKQAAIQIQRERTVAVVAGAGGQVTSDTETIPSGVILSITPWVVEDERVRLDVQVEQSNFIDNLSPGVLVEKDANKAQTSMHVRSGQSVVIGGLALQETSSSNSGLPWLRHIPLVNLLASKQRSTERKQDVIVFVTPYVWTPSVDPPFPSPEAFKFQEIDELTALEQWKRRFIRP
jgi:type II secretory pathway component GspD/PulD (secretin)